MTRSDAALAAMLAALLLGAPVAVHYGISGYVLSVATRAAITAIAAASLQFMLSFGGLVSLGHAATAGIGAYVVLAAGGADTLIALPGAVLAAAAFAWLTGLVALRTSGVTFIMITLAFGQMAYFVAQALALFGGDDGMALDQRSKLAGQPWLEQRSLFHLICTTALAATVLLLRQLARSPYGRVLRAARQNPIRAAALGFNVSRIRLAAYTLGGAGGGLSGFFLANNSEFVSPALLDWRGSGHLLVIAILGGAGPWARSVDGALLGAALAALALTAAEEMLAGITEHGALVLGPALVLVALLGRR